MWRTKVIWTWNLKIGRRMEFEMWECWRRFGMGDISGGRSGKANRSM